MLTPLPIRAEDPTPEAVVIIRAGVMSRANADRSARRAMQRHGVFAISVEAVIDSTVAETCRSSRRIGDLYKQIRLWTVGRVSQIGFAVVATFEHPHFSIVLPDVTEYTLARLEECFDQPISNPALGPKA